MSFYFYGDCCAYEFNLCTFAGVIIRDVIWLETVSSIRSNCLFRYNGLIGPHVGGHTSLNFWYVQMFSCILCIVILVRSLTWNNQSKFCKSKKIFHILFYQFFWSGFQGATHHLGNQRHNDYFFTYAVFNYFVCDP